MKHLLTAMLLTSCNTWTVQDVVKSDKQCAYIVVKGGEKSQFIYGPCEWEKGQSVKIP